MFKLIKSKNKAVRNRDNLRLTLARRANFKDSPRTPRWILNISRKRNL